MATAAQRQRLIDGLAYIHSHRQNWVQRVWRTFTPNETKHTCGTFGCLAGHLAITLNPSKPVVQVPDQIWLKPRTELTAEERHLIDLAHEFSDYVLARGDDDKDAIESQDVDGVNIRTVHVQHRAEKLIGGLRHPGGGIDLFDGGNSWSRMLSIGAELLGMDTEALMKEIETSVKAHGWDKKPRAKKASASQA